MPELDPQVREKLLSAVQGGASLETAARSAGLSEAETRALLDYGELVEEVGRAYSTARAVAEVRLLQERPGEWLKGPGKAAPSQPRATLTDVDPMRRCNARARKGRPCRGPAIRGLEKCRMHCGLSKAQIRDHLEQWEIKERVRARVGREMERLHRSGTDPLDALREVIDDAAIMRAVLRDEVRALNELHGRNHLNDGAPDVRVIMLGEWSDRLARYAKLAIDAGFQERQLQISEETAETLMRAFEAAMEESGLPDELRGETARALSRHLKLVTDASA